MSSRNICSEIAEGFEHLKQEREIKKRERQQSESLEKAIEDAKQRHQQFLEETGIDLKALVASGFDANSGKQESENGRMD